MPKAYTTNEVVSLDLKERGDMRKEILYICDEFSGFIVAEVINNKEPETIIKAFVKRWVREGPGIPSKGLFMDNGGEFRNSKLKELASKLGISLKFTAAHSPWSNGKNERNHFTCDQVIDKLMEEDPTLTRRSQKFIDQQDWLQSKTIDVWEARSGARHHRWEPS